MLPRSVKVNNLQVFEEGKVCGIESPSAIVVKCLDLQADSVVLDMCCSPGAKLLAISDTMRDLSPSDYSSRVVGVDISSHRANTCRSMLAKAGHGKVRVFTHDAVEVAKVWPADLKRPNRVVVDVECTHEGSIKHIVKYLEHESHVADEE